VSLLILAATTAQLAAYLLITHSAPAHPGIAPLALPPRTGDCRIFVAVFTGAGRAEILSVQMAAWEWLLAQPFVAGLAFLGHGPITAGSGLIRRHYVDIVPAPNDTSWHFLCTKIHTAVKLFMDTGADWLLRICDDALINVATFGAFFAELNQFADPATERIFQGHLIAKPLVRLYVYPQGGSGIVISRFAAEEIWRESAEFLFVCAHVRNDDRGIGLWMLKHNVSAWNATNRWFVGHHFRYVKGGALKIPEYLPNVGPCPAYPATRLGIRPFFARVKDITFWHDRGRFQKFGSALPAMRRSLPENLFFHPGGEWPLLCFATAETESRFYA
jgi:hypothetical protein